LVALLRITENQLEQAVIDKLQHFLLEMGKGFSFVARQKRITMINRHYFIDLAVPLLFFDNNCKRV